MPENKSPIATTAKEIEEQHQKVIEAAIIFAINTVGEFRYPIHIKDLNEIVKDYANIHKLIGYNEQILRRWLKARNQVEEILPDIFALREWSYQRKKGILLG